MNSSSTSSSTSKRIKYSNLVLHCQVDQTEIKMPFNYFPTEIEFQEVLHFVTSEIEPGDQPALIDLTGPDPEYSPPVNIVCVHNTTRCGKFYGGLCKGVPAVNQDHLHVYHLCGYCETETTDCMPTGNSDEWVCATCVEAQDELNFCKRCDRFEECDDALLCGKCQSIMGRKVYAIKPAPEDLEDDEPLSEDEEDEAALSRTQDGYVKDGFVVSDEEEEESPSPEPVCRIKRRIQGAASRSYNDVHWDLMTEVINK